MITYERQVMSIVKITNMKLIDHHKPDLKSALRDVIFITLANGEIKRLDLYSFHKVSRIQISSNYVLNWLIKSHSNKTISIAKFNYLKMILIQQ